MDDQTVDSSSDIINTTATPAVTTAAIATRPLLPRFQCMNIIANNLTHKYACAQTHTNTLAHLIYIYWSRAGLVTMRP